MPPFIRASLVVFIASFCTLVLEIVAGRLLAPYVGVSLYTWTSIIGVVLAGISAGAYAGGWLADRRPAESTLGWLLLASGVSASFVVPATEILAGDQGLLTAFGIATTLLTRVVVLSFLLFFVPCFILGMISPVAVKVAVQDLRTAGSVVGRIYAFSTLGSIAGTFVTGFWLVARFGTKATVFGVGATLFFTALIFGGLLPRAGRVTATGVVALLLLAGALYRTPLAPPPLDPLLSSYDGGVLHEEESQYYTIRIERSVRDDNGAPLNALHLDHLTHSYADLADPLYLEYGYLQIFNDVITTRAQRGTPMRLLFIGGGGYTLPRLVERVHPSAQIDVVEIDPAVTQVARRWMGVPRSARIRTYNEDARWFAMRKHEPYDLILIDAFNDLSVPYHLTTREVTELFSRLLHHDGAVVANIVDDYKRGRFLPAYARTLQSVFGADAVSVIAESEEDLGLGRSTFVLMASTAIAPPDGWHVLGGDQLRDYVRERKALVLTDDYAPVDNMLAPLFTERFVDEVTE